MSTDNTRFLIESAFSILDKNSREVPFILNTVQDRYWNNIRRRDIVLKARKMGFSTIRLARMLAKCQIMQNRRCVVVSHEKESTQRLLGRARHMLESMPFPVETGRAGLGTITFPSTNSSIWIGTAGQKAFGRGDDITDYHLSEFAFWQNPDLITGIEEACVHDSEGCIESTANGWGTPFHRLWERASSGESGMKVADGSPVFYTPHFFAWFDDPEYQVPISGKLENLTEYETKLMLEHGVTEAQLNWRRLKINSMYDPSMFPQEYPATPEEAFLVSGLMVFDSATIRKHEIVARKEKWRGEIIDQNGKATIHPTEKGRLAIYISPEETHSYIISADVAAGIRGEAYSVADVLDAESGEQVAQWRGHCSPGDFGDILMLMGAFYNWALLIPEVNNHGLTVCTRIEDRGYPNLYTRPDNRGGSELGFFTSPGESGTRAQMINELREAITEFKIKLNSPDTMRELRSFVRLENGKLGPQPGTFSDCVMSAAIGAYVLSERIYTPERSQQGFKSRLGITRRRSRGRIHIPNGRGRYV